MDSRRPLVEELVLYHNTCQCEERGSEERVYRCNRCMATYDLDMNFLPGLNDEHHIVQPPEFLEQEYDNEFILEDDTPRPAGPVIEYRPINFTDGTWQQYNRL